MGILRSPGIKTRFRFGQAKTGIPNASSGSIRKPGQSIFAPLPNTRTISIAGVRGVIGGIPSRWTKKRRNWTLSKAVRKYSLRFGTTEHLGARWNWFGIAKGSDTKGPLAGVPYDGIDPKYAELYQATRAGATKTGIGMYPNCFKESGLTGSRIWWTITKHPFTDRGRCAFRAFARGARSPQVRKDWARIANRNAFSEAQRTCLRHPVGSCCRMIKWPGYLAAARSAILLAAQRFFTASRMALRPAGLIRRLLGEALPFFRATEGATDA
jgi:hypothetical protein